MANIDTEIAEIEGASTGEEVRQSLVDGLNAVNAATLPVVSQSDAGKFMVVNNLGQWEVKSGGLVPTPTGTKSITQNGTHDVTDYASADVNVPNSYSASDEGKVVDDGALVSQTSRNVTQNGTYDTTTNNEVVVNVQGGGEGGVIQPLSVTQNGTYTPPSGVDGYAPVTVSVSGGCQYDSVFEVHKADFSGGSSNIAQGRMDNNYVVAYFHDNMSNTYTLNGAQQAFSVLSAGRGNGNIHGTTVPVQNSAAQMGSFAFENGSTFITRHDDSGSYESFVGGWIGLPAGGTIYENANSNTESNTIVMNSAHKKLCIVVGASNTELRAVGTIDINNVTYPIKNIGYRYDGVYALCGAYIIENNSATTITVTFPSSVYGYVSIIGFDS